MTLFKAACVQVNASNDMQTNIAHARDMVRTAATQGARLICLPENVAMMEFGGENVIAKSYAQDDHPGLKAFRDLAVETTCWLLIGSLAIRLDNGKVANRSFLLNDQGEIVAQYDKIHLFDVDLGGGESYRESNTFDGGDRAVLVQTPLGKLALSICYDVRFPHLYRDYAQASADIIMVPAAFTKQTGQAHWKVLLRARAIETGCYIIAPGQCGEHKGGRETYGHSLIINPWGEVLAEGGDEPCILLGDIDLNLVGETRSKIPSLQHDRTYQLDQS